MNPGWFRQYQRHSKWEAKTAPKPRAAQQAIRNSLFSPTSFHGFPLRMTVPRTSCAPIDRKATIILTSLCNSCRRQICSGPDHPSRQSAIHIHVTFCQLWRSIQWINDIFLRTSTSRQWFTFVGFPTWFHGKSQDMRRPMENPMIMYMTPYREGRRKTGPSENGVLRLTSKRSQATPDPQFLAYPLV